MDLFFCSQFPRSDAKSHSQTQIESHLNLALCGLEATQHQVHELVTVVKDQSQQMGRLSEQIGTLMSKDKEQSQQIERQSQQIERQSQHIERQSQHIGRLSGKIERQSRQIERIERLMSKAMKQSEKVERSMSAVQHQTPPRARSGAINKTFSTPFEWKIPNAEAVRERATIEQQRLVSKPFCLFARGYNYLLRIEINFDSRLPSQTANDDLRVHIKVVPGEFDELLSWPCTEKVRVSLVHRNSNLLLDSTNDISYVIDFGEEPCFRPLHDDHHKDRFILGLNRYQLPSYIKDDTILIRVNRE